MNDTEPDPAVIAALFAKTNDRPEHMATEFNAGRRPNPDRVRNLTGRAARRRALKDARCALCQLPMAANDRMEYRTPDPRPEKWGVMTKALGHARCVATGERMRAEAAERALAALSDAARVNKTTTETADRQQAMGLWTPR